MLLLNFAHPLTDEHLAQIAELAQQPIDAVRTIPVQIKQSDPLEEQIVALADAAELGPEQWQTQTLIVNPPSYAPAAFALLAELHGRMGHFPSLLRMRPRQGTTTTYEVAEIVNMQSMREQARLRR